jgi:8-oxo-dGTP diphosphatase
MRREPSERPHMAAREGASSRGAVVRLGCHASGVGTDSGDWSARLPRLFAESYVDYAAARTTYLPVVPSEALVSRLHLVAVTAESLVVVCRSDQGWRFLPGGTREPGESLHDLARRELHEEAGADLLGDLIHFSAHQVDSDRSQPYRPHLPHPRAYWAYAAARVEITGRPSNPPGGERVIEVLALPPATAAAYLDVEDPVHADVVRHAEALGLLEQLA